MVDRRCCTYLVNPVTPVPDKCTRYAASTGNLVSFDRQMSKANYFAVDGYVSCNYPIHGIIQYEATACLDRYIVEGGLSNSDAKQVRNQMRVSCREVWGYFSRYSGLLTNGREVTDILY
jgi:hypothetical protein